MEIVITAEVYDECIAKAPWTFRLLAIIPFFWSNDVERCTKSGPSLIYAGTRQYFIVEEEGGHVIVGNVHATPSCVASTRLLLTCGSMQGFFDLETTYSTKTLGPDSH